MLKKLTNYTSQDKHMNLTIYKFVINHDHKCTNNTKYVKSEHRMNKIPLKLFCLMEYGFTFKSDNIRTIYTENFINKTFSLKKRTKKIHTEKSQYEK